jgi:epsilon-lactone hydrolase
MSSPQMHVVAAFMRLALKGKAVPDPVAASKEPPRPPAKLVQRHDVRSRRIDGFECHTVSPRGRRAERAVVYLHGGAYIRHLSPRHWQLISQLVDADEAAWARALSASRLTWPEAASAPVP